MEKVFFENNYLGKFKIVIDKENMEKYDLWNMNKRRLS